jgi:hypothetical protein
MDIKSKIQKPREAVQTSGLKLLVYGQSGVGKTTLCATTGDPTRTLILSAEAGLLSIAASDVDTLPVASLADLREAYAYLKAGQHEYTWVCLDSLSEIAEKVLESEKATAKDPRAAYGEMADLMVRMVKNFRDLPMNVVMISKGKPKDDEGRLTYAPTLPGQRLTDELPFLFDEVFCLVAAQTKDGEVRRALRTTSDGKYMAKDRSGKLDEWEVPNLQAVYNKIHGR